MKKLNRKNRIKQTMKIADIDGLKLFWVTPSQKVVSSQVVEVVKDRGHSEGCLSRYTKVV